MLLAAACGTSQQTSTNQPTQNPTPTTTSLENSAALVEGMGNIFTQKGYSLDNNFGPNKDLWWLDISGIFINAPGAIATAFDITKTSPTDYDISAMQSAPDISPAMTAADAYMANQGFAIQANQSTGTAGFQTALYTHAYFNPGNSIRCRIEIGNLYGGEGETPPYTFTANFSCIDNQQYLEAYNAQQPLLNAVLASLSTYNNAKWMMEFNPNYKPSCVKDPSITLFTLQEVSGTEAGLVKAVKCNNGSCIDTGMTPSQIDSACR